MQYNRPYVIVFTGPESTAKSTVSKAVAHQLNAFWVPEHARTYVEGLNRSYTFDDVEAIAKLQKEAYEEALRSKKEVIVFDTFLIITKIWMKEVYGEVPQWIDAFLQSMHVDLHLLCYPDIDWVDDGVRENKDKRHYLYACYEQELKHYGFDYALVRGQGEARRDAALQHIYQHLKIVASYG
ncbi:MULTISPECIES: AAA family ATPase [unclassified Carboxylicivirga]|uniref:AAA family ATPase n=1 Tax=Carboxylicivirga TaxID=1628153 RepID=UPI003D336936